MPTAPSQLARDAAIRRLIAEHETEFGAFLVEERVARGLSPEVIRGHAPVERVPAPAVCLVVNSAKVTAKLGISSIVWRTWVTRGIPVGREADVADALGLPLEVLWPELKPAAAEEPKPKRAKTEKAEPNPWYCDRCSERFRTRADLARHRLHTGHGHEDVA